MEQGFVHAHSNAELPDGPLQFLVNLVGYEADADVRLDALWREVEHRPHFKVRLPARSTTPSPWYCLITSLASRSVFVI